MRYIGGKYRIRNDLVRCLGDSIQKTNCFVEPFCGSCNIVYSVVSDFMNGYEMSGGDKSKFKIILNDFHKDLMMMWQEIICNGWEPPDNCTEEEYEALRHAEPSALRGFVGHGCSFGGIWFSKFARETAKEKVKIKKYDEEVLLFDVDEFGDEPEPIIAEERNFCKNAKNSIMEIANFLKKYNVKLYNKSYDEFEIPDGSVIYCDPPYIGTAKPGSGNEFDHEKFWEWVRKMSEKNEVFVSEYVAPYDFESVINIDVRLDMNREERIERLFKYKG